VPLAQAAQLPFASTLCGACRDVCPVAIDIPRLLLHLRQQVREGSAATPAALPKRSERAAMRVLAWVLRSPRRYRFAMAVARWCRWLEPLLHRLPPLSSWRQGRSVPRLAPKDLRTLWRERGRR
ncbi:MAG: lactate utilization protein LutB domain-containing protein, partial [Planctomycetota bacterium]